MSAKKYIYLIALGFLLGPSLSQAAGEIQLSPAKVEAVLPAGSSLKRELTLTNRTDKVVQFRVSTEDFDSSADPQVPVELLGDQRGRYSLKDHLQISKNDQNFSLSPGEKRTVSVSLTFPTTTPSGAYYGSVIFAAYNVADDRQAQIVSRLGALFFARVAGTVKESGLVREFGLMDHDWTNQGPFHFALLFENNGEVYLNPYGLIKVKNIWGQEVASLGIDPWFVLPRSLREKEVLLNKKLSSGYYRATAQINRGYDNIVDTRTAAFLILTRRDLGLGLLIFMLVAWGIQYFIRSRSKSKK